MCSIDTSSHRSLKPPQIAGVFFSHSPGSSYQHHLGTPSVVSCPPMATEDPTQAKEAFAEAFTLYKDAIFRHCYFKVFDREWALELTQECFLKTWEYMGKGNTIENIRAFLYKTATNHCLNALQKKRETSLDALQEQGFDPGMNDPALNRDYMAEEEALALLQKLNEPYRTAVTLRYIEGLSVAEIADITGEEANTVSAHISLGIKFLRFPLRTDA